MNVKVVYLKKEDELPEVVEKVILAKEKRVILVIPPRSYLGRHRLNLQILKREAEYAGKEIFIDTEDEFLRDLAKEEGLKLVDDYSDLISFSPVRKKKSVVSDILPPKGSTSPLEEANRRVEYLEEEEADRGEEIEIVKEHSPSKRTRITVSFDEPLSDSVDRELEAEAPDFWSMLEKRHLRKAGISNFSKEDEGVKKSDYEQILPANKKKKILNYLVFSLFGAGIIGLIYLSFFVLPKAKIILDLVKAQKTVEFELTASAKASKVDFANYTLPAKLLSFERTAKKVFPATGNKEIATKASGVIRIYNAYSSKPQVLVATTRFQSSDGKIFRIPKRIVVPGAKVEGGKIVPSYIEVKVYADKPGEEYNIGPDKFTIPGFKGSPKYYGFYAKSFEPMKGGARKMVKVVTKEDIEKAKNEVEKELMFLLEKEFEEKIPAGYLKLNGDWVLSKKILEVDAQPGEAKDNFTVTADFVLKGLIFKREDIDKLAMKIFQSLSEAKEWNIQEVGYSFSNPKIDLDKENLSVGVKAIYSLIEKLDKEQIKREVLGKNSSEIKRVLLARKEINSAKIIFWPFWVRKVPKNLDRVEVEIK